MASRDYEKMVIYPAESGQKSIASAKDTPQFNNPPQGTPAPQSQPAHPSPSVPQGSVPQSQGSTQVAS